MPRQLRIEYPGAIYHVVDRGDRREDIFRDDWDRRCFLKTLAETCAKTGFQVHAYCLMINYFHLVIETPTAGLVNGMRWLLSTYIHRFIHRPPLAVVWISQALRLHLPSLLVRFHPMKTSGGTVQIPTEVLASVETLDELEDWLMAQNPQLMRELKQARRDDLAGKFKLWKPRHLPCPPTESNLGQTDTQLADSDRLMIATLKTCLVNGMRWLLGTYTNRSFPIPPIHGWAGWLMAALNHRHTLQKSNKIGVKSV